MRCSILPHYESPYNFVPKLLVQYLVVLSSTILEDVQGIQTEVIEGRAARCLWFKFFHVPVLLWYLTWFWWTFVGVNS